MPVNLQHLAKLRGRENLNALWRHLLGQEAKHRGGESERRQAWYAGAKYDFFLSDKGEELVLELWAARPQAELYEILPGAWAEHHIRDGITF